MSRHAVSGQAPLPVKVPAKAPGTAPRGSQKPRRIFANLRRKVASYRGVVFQTPRVAPVPAPDPMSEDLSQQIALGNTASNDCSGIWHGPCERCELIRTEHSLTRKPRTKSQVHPGHVSTTTIARQINLPESMQKPTLSAVKERPAHDNHNDGMQKRVQQRRHDSAISAIQGSTRQECAPNRAPSNQPAHVPAVILQERKFVAQYHRAMIKSQIDARNFAQQNKERIDEWARQNGEYPEPMPRELVDEGPSNEDSPPALEVQESFADASEFPFPRTYVKVRGASPTLMEMPKTPPIRPYRWFEQTLSTCVEENAEAKGD